MTGKKSHKKKTIAEVKKALSDEENRNVRDKLDKAEKSLDDIKNLFYKIPFLSNGKLSTGSIDYAAFRIETLSLIFEFVYKHLRKSGKEDLYNNFLSDLGNEIGFTFARDLLKRLSDSEQFLNVNDLKGLLELWASFENDTGAGETSIKKCTSQKIIINIRKNPLRKKESFPHIHCKFYTNYIQSLINELSTSRSRLLQNEIDGSKIQSFKVSNIIEEPDALDNCQFKADLMPENLTIAFDKLFETYNQFYGLEESSDYDMCLGKARSALVKAQMEAINLHSDNTPQNLYKIYKPYLSKLDFSRMNDVYHRCPRKKSQASWGWLGFIFPLKLSLGVLSGIKDWLIPELLTE